MSFRLVSSDKRLSDIPKVGDIVYDDDIWGDMFEMKVLKVFPNGTILADEHLTSQDVLKYMLVEKIRKLDMWYVWEDDNKNKEEQQ